MTSLNLAELYARLRAKEKSKILSSEQIHNRNLQWLKDITDEAKSLFKKECKTEVTSTLLEESETSPCKEGSKELDDSGCSNIILLPKTPREKKARAARIQKVMSRSPGGPSYSQCRSGRAASRAAQSRIHTTLNEKLNAKKRRPTETDGGKTNTSEYASSINTDESVNSEEENEKPPSGRSSGYSTISQRPRSVEKSALAFSQNHNCGKLDDSSTSKSHTEEKMESIDSGKSVHFENENNIDKPDGSERPVFKKRRSSTTCEKSDQASNEIQSKISKCDMKYQGHYVSDTQQENINIDVTAEHRSHNNSDVNIKGHESPELKVLVLPPNSESLTKEEENDPCVTKVTVILPILATNVCSPQNVTEKKSECNTIQSTIVPITITSCSPIITNDTPIEQITLDNTAELQAKSITDSSSEDCKILSKDGSSNKPDEMENKSTSPSVAPTSQMITAVENDEQASTARPERVLRSQSSSSVTASENEDEIVVRRSTRAKKKPAHSPNHQTSSKKIKLTAQSPLKLAHDITSKTANTPNPMGGKSVSLASLRHPNRLKNMLHSSIKDGKNCSTSALIAAAKGASSSIRSNTNRKFTPQSPLKDASSVNAALGIIGSGGQHYSFNNSSGISGLSKFRSRIGNIHKSPLKSATKIGGNIVNIRSFLPQKPAKPAKLTANEVQAKKQEELNQKQSKADEAIRKKEEADRAKQEQRRLQNEARQKRVHEARQAKEQQKIHERERIEKQSKERQDAIGKARIMAEEKRRQEQEERRKIEIEQEKIRIEEEKEKKCQQEELERKRAQKAEEERIRRVEEYNLQRQQAAQEEENIREQVLKKGQIKKPQNLDETYNKESSATSGTSHPLNQNSTFTKENSARVANTTVTSYDITPARHELPPEELIDEDNYDIGDLRSDEDTDDEDNPRKIIPKWAQSSQFKTAIMKQAFRPPDLDSIFFVMETSVELAEIFPIEKRRFKQRTSSAVWLKAPTTHNLDYTNKTNNLK